MGTKTQAVKNSDGRELHVSDWLFRMAKDYGWTSGLLDSDFADAVHEGRNDYGDKSYAVWQSLGACRESANAMDIARGNQKPGFDGGYSGVWFADGLPF